ncbi:MAG: purine-nucleoside phosphorylase [Candidatus Aureabacteria bacterium]|nr:purine-nucleoside phosphorylase [Candidatus Auribacterota bacterium]
MIIDPTKIRETVDFIKNSGAVKPAFALILGSGLGDVADLLEKPVFLPYSDIPHFPASSVKGHAGKLAIGSYRGKGILVQVGRAHFYEGLGAERVMYPLWVMKALGVTTLINTNSAGGINPSFAGGDLMMVTDFINFMFTNPLIGPNDEKVGPRFPDMSKPYDAALQETARQAAKKVGVPLREGVLIGFLGPSYETKAEIAMAMKLGADAAGMSSIPETIVANYLGIKLLAITCISNLVSHTRTAPLTHDEVTAAGAAASRNLRALIAEILNQIK